MHPQIDRIRKIRQYILKIIEPLTIDQLNEIPQGFNNNIVWNVAHLTAAQQGLCYIRAGLKTFVEEAYFLAYKAETKPEEPVDDVEWDNIKALLFSSLDQLQQDYDAGTFNNYTSWTTRYDVTLSTIDDALDFILFHEGLHLGYIMALKRVITH